jgi:hypothetical protein
VFGVRHRFRASAYAWAAVAFATGTLVPVGAYAQTAAGSAIQQQQLQVVYQQHKGAIDAAEGAVNSFSRAISDERAAITGDQAAVVSATADAGQAQTRLAADGASLEAATVAHSAATRALADDRRRLGGIALAIYTGAVTSPELAGAKDFQSAQTAEFNFTQVEVVAEMVDRNIQSDLATDRHDAEVQTADTTTVANDRSDLGRAESQAAAAATALRSDQGLLAVAQKQLATADLALGSAEQALTASINSLAGPGSTPAGQLSLLGGAALTPTELASWFDYEGYVDLTSAPIQQLASWYIQYGQQEGVRGDVAFAQAVLETGGFSSPDAVDLSNFAGIGHCDTCSSGWAFPSPSGGVLGQIQLLRIFAASSPGPAKPGPVLPALTPARQFETGCCSTVESLTGVWATDPTYGSQILTIYAQMLAYALSSAP